MADRRSIKRRIGPRTGRPLKGLTAADLVPHSEEARRLHDDLTADGFTLQRGCRPYLRKDWMVSMRFVWRRRREGETVTLSILCPAGLHKGQLVIGVKDGLQVGWSRQVSVQLGEV